MPEIAYWLPICFFIIALCYALVGFGGGSSYLAVLVLAGLPYYSIPALALSCNLIVTAGGCYHFYCAGHFKIKNIFPYIVSSVPMAYLGGRLFVEKELFCLLLGISLLAVAVRLFLPNHLTKKTKEISWREAWLIGLPLGALLGFLSGLVGIGGGIFLSPILLLLGWVHVKEAAAAASFFIVLNSLAGLLGQLHKGMLDMSLLIPLGIAVFAGGQIGSRLGAHKLPKVRLQQLLAVLVLYVSIKLLMEV